MKKISLREVVRREIKVLIDFVKLSRAERVCILAPLALKRMQQLFFYNTPFSNYIFLDRIPFNYTF